MTFSGEFYNAFVKVWNENADEYVKKNNMKVYDNLLVVNYFDKEIKEDSLYHYATDIILFYMVFNGSVCDLDHWNYFKECLINASQKSRIHYDFDQNYSVFRECWNEHIDEINKQFESKFAGNNCVIVIAGKTSFWYKLKPNTLKCFYNTFNGPVCDYDHWKYFKECIIKASKMTGIEAEKFHCIRDEEFKVVKDFKDKSSSSFRNRRLSEK